MYTYIHIYIHTYSALKKAGATAAGSKPRSETLSLVEEREERAQEEEQFPKARGLVGKR